MAGTEGQRQNLACSLLAAIICPTVLLHGVGNLVRLSLVHNSVWPRFSQATLARFVFILPASPPHSQETSSSHYIFLLTGLWSCQWVFLCLQPLAFLLLSPTPCGNECFQVHWEFTEACHKVTDAFLKLQLPPPNTAHVSSTAKTAG